MQNWLLCLTVHALMLLSMGSALHGQVPGTVYDEEGKLAYVANDPAYRAYASLTGRADDPNRVHTDLFAPILSTDDDLLFAGGMRKRSPFGDVVNVNEPFVMNPSCGCPDRSTNHRRDCLMAGCCCRDRRCQTRARRSGRSIQGWMRQGRSWRRVL
ncbi:secreted protein [Rhodopirellula sallentina SM41]|uniref:Secreted protein n=1 Tax=Rhodopirellula sallentina SM41 TaxID=1263870 RepID=M5U3Y4_9BACT|nr:secreted protein [Rhodopirellula sallentina SM41]